MLPSLAVRLTEELGFGFSESSLKYMQLFYLRYPVLLEIRHSPRDESNDGWPVSLNFPTPSLSARALQRIRIRGSPNPSHARRRSLLSRPDFLPRQAAVASAPTDRQREYLEFIKKFMHRFGVAPAESDIQRHFLVSAPSVNQMIRTLEQKGFLVRDRDWSGHAVPRSIRVLWES